MFSVNQLCCYLSLQYNCRKAQVLRTQTASGLRSVFVVQATFPFQPAHS